MSRVGSKPITLPGGVTVNFDRNVATVKGPKGAITRPLPATCIYAQEGNVVRVRREGNDNAARSIHGLARALLTNMVVGVTEGYAKELEVVGIGYKAEVKGKQLVLTIGLSHPVNFAIPDGVKVETPSPTQIKISGIEKDLVGQVCADIRGVRPPEPYKGKGIKYVGEYIKRKAGKTAVSQGT
jgi:large subunit ribosomal protein L6